MDDSENLRHVEPNKKLFVSKVVIARINQKRHSAVSDRVLYYTEISDNFF